MINIPLGKARERFDALPEHLKEVLFSEKSTDVIWDLGEDHHLNGERTKKIADLTGAVILGFVHPEDLAKEFQKEVNLPAQVANSIAEEINKKILAPIIDEITSLYHWGEVREPQAPVQTVGDVRNVGNVNAQPAQELKPAFAETSSWKPIPESPPTDTNSPFMLHEEGAVEQAQAQDGAPSLARPYFFEPDEAPAPAEQKPISARLEVDEATTAYPYSGPGGAAPKVGRTEKPQIRVVHYTGLSSPVGDVGSVEDVGAEQLEQAERSNKQSGQTTPTNEAIHPNNVVNLKDLPK
ncbi:MAG: hypothetical protein HYS89_01405 [Candidatus Colwellbacteria bacterium]|nr:hypothetical protein [Candidatus Colwellbacteria bacterium]